MAVALKWAVTAFLLGSWLSVSGELSCKDMDGKDVDWFVALKIPKLPEAMNKVHPDISEGIAFYYGDANNPEMRLSQKNINDPQSALGYTATQAIEAHKTKNKDVMYMFYNDQQPCSVDCDKVKAEPKAAKKPKKAGKWLQDMINSKFGDSLERFKRILTMNKAEGGGEKDYTNRAHAKGVMNFNDKQGFWLIHSAPRYVDPLGGKYFYPDNARSNGQSFFCGTFSTDQLKEISVQIFHSQFAVYHKNLPLPMAQKFPRLYHVMHMDKTIESKSSCPYFRNAALQTKGGQWLQNYEKNVQADSDLWANQVTEHKQKSFFVETWPNGSPNWQPVCKGPYFTKNIRVITHPEGVTWTNTKDHSKWGVSDKPMTVCIGDINRQASQRRRGGGTMCIDNEKVWKFFRDSVGSADCCPNEKDKCEAVADKSIEVPAKSRNPGDPEPEK